MTMQYVFSQLQRSTVELLLWDTSIQGTPPFRGHKIWSLKNVQIIFIFVTPVEETPLFRGKEPLFLEPGRFLTPLPGDTLVLEK